MKLLRATWVAPMNRPPIEHGAVGFEEGRIVFAGAWEDARRTYGADAIEDLGDAIILPGLVNAHTHLELSTCTAAASRTSFVDWALSVAAQTNAADLAQSDAWFADAVAHGVEQCVRFGVTSVGDISQRCDITRPQLARGPLRVVSYGEALGIGRNRPRFDERLARATDMHWQSEFLRIGLSPHAPYSVDRRGFVDALALARERALPLATHLAELPFEAEFLERQTGPLRELLDRIGTWNDDIETHKSPPIQFAHAIGLLDYPTLLAHVNYCDDHELALLVRGRASVVYCPRTHRYFDHPPHRWREMLARGINVAIGTDSCASSPDLNLVNELRALHGIAPEVEPLTLWAMATSRAAAAIGRLDVGTIEPNRAADFTVFTVSGKCDPLGELLEGQGLPRQTWINGVLIYDQ